MNVQSFVGVCMQISFADAVRQHFAIRIKQLCLCLHVTCMRVSCVCVYVHVLCVCVCVCVCLHTYIYIYICTLYICTYIYIYLYIHYPLNLTTFAETASFGSVHSNFVPELHLKEVNRGYDKVFHFLSLCLHCLPLSVKFDLKLSLSRSFFHSFLWTKLLFLSSLFSHSSSSTDNVHTV